jgi:ribosome-associated toxin RatA of RatAB toxin-antitoxin module
VPDSAVESEIIAATPEHCFAVATDVEQYPQWAHDVKEVTIRERDAQSRPVLVDYRVAALGRSSSYSLKYDYSQAPTSISWHLAEGDIERAIDGEYRFESSGDSTKVTYLLSIELIVPIPGFIKRRAEGRILHTLKELKVRCES